MDGPENGNFLLLYVVKMSLHRRWVAGLKKAQTNPYVSNIKMVPYGNCSEYQDFNTARKGNQKII